MKTLTEHIDDLDRMVDQGADIPKIRSQIAFIGREIAALEAAYAKADEDNTKLREADAKREQEAGESLRQSKPPKRSTLHYD